MTKKYALIYPAFTYAYDGLADLPALVIEPLHKFTYAKICGYSLGHQPKFFETLEEAKEFNVSTCMPKIAKQNAVIELDVEDENILAVSKIHNVKEVQLTQPSEKYAGFHEPVTKMEWEDRDVVKADLTEGALEELNIQYRGTQPQLAVTV